MRGKVSLETMFGNKLMTNFAQHLNMILFVCVYWQLREERSFTIRAGVFVCIWEPFRTVLGLHMNIQLIFVANRYFTNITPKCSLVYCNMNL